MFSLKACSWYGIACLSLGLIGCGSYNTGSDASIDSIIGIDSRNVLDSKDINNKIGTVNYQGKPICTAFASGINQITTASHCLNGNFNDDYSITINYRTVPINSVKIYSNSDVATIKVNGISDYFKAAGLSKSVPSSLISYAVDKQKFVITNENGFLQKENFGLIKHYHDTLPGSSGAPLLQNGKVVGVHIGAIIESNKVINVSSAYLEIKTASLEGVNYSPECGTYNPFCGGGMLDAGKTKFKICGRTLKVPTLMYGVCATALYAMPVGCTAGAVMTAGAACPVAIGVAGVSCSIGTTVLTDIAKSCMAGKY